MIHSTPFSLLVGLRIFIVVIWMNHHISVVTTVMAQRYSEIQRHVVEKVNNFMNPPVFALDVMHDLYKIDGFPHRLEAPDRDRAMKNIYSIITAQNDTGVKVYYGMESGLFLGYTSSQYDRVPILNYREPGESGYDPLNDKEMDKYWDICVDKQTGIKETCRMEAGESYVSCANNCNILVKCPDDDSQRRCSLLTDDQEKIDCEKNIKWCKNYSIETLAGRGRMGYVPTAYSCINSRGQFSDVPGDVQVEVFNEDTNSVSVELGDCTFQSGAMVTKRISGPYAYCGGNGANENATTCTTYTGVFQTRNYDPRLRGWYIGVKKSQSSRWSDPYVFFTNSNIGITYSIPLYSTDETGRNVFAGVLGADYLLTDISRFLVEAYRDTDTIVGIYEYAEPHNVIALSTGSFTSKKVLSSDHSRPCTSEGEECEVIRVSITELDETNNEGDLVLKNAHIYFDREGYDFDSGEMESIKVDPEDVIYSAAYSGSSLIYEHPGSNLRWKIIVLRRMERSDDNSIVEGDGLFYVICAIAPLGFLLCFTLLVVFFKNRKQEAVKFADLRFTSAFIFACALLNLSVLCLLGENTDDLCMTRMWVMFMAVSMVLSPLFVKAYRTWKLIGANLSQGGRRKQMTNFSAWLRTLPIPLMQMSILLAFTFLDPPKSSEEINTDNIIPVQKIRCHQESWAFTITQSVFHFILICAGCILSYMTRNFDSKISDSKPLLFAMYNITFTILMIGCIAAVVDLAEQGQRVMQAIGIFWATVFSSSAFVIPRLIQARTEIQLKQSVMSQRRRSRLISRRNERTSTVESDADVNANNADSFSAVETLNVLVCTANIGNAKPSPSSMAAWIPLGGNCSNVTPMQNKSFQSTKFDLIVIGMQEATWSSSKDKQSKSKRQSSFRSLASGSSLGSYGDGDDVAVDEEEEKENLKADAELHYLAALEGEDTVSLRRMINDLLGQSYMSVAEEARGEMRLYIYALNEVAPFVEDMKITGANTGVGNVLANKGGIVISFEYMKTRLSFLSAHLAAHEGQSYYQARCENIRDILKSSNNPQTDCDASISSHHMFILGDLNFRTKFGDDKASHSENVNRAMKLIEDEDFDTLYSFDELQKGITNGELLVQFQTLPCNFNPTFKVQRMSGFVYKDQRTPSYTDRVLFRSYCGLENKLKTLAYEPCVDFITSDHKPVRGAFSIVPNEIIDPIRVAGKLELRFHEMSGSDLHAGDLNGFSDPYLMIVWDGIDVRRNTKNALQSSILGRFGKQSWPRTQTKRKTLNPVWEGEEISLVLDEHTIKAEATMVVLVKDYDFGTKDSLLGALSLDLKELVSKVNFEKKTQVEFDRPLVRNGKFDGRVKFTLDLAITQSQFLKY